MLNMRSLSKCKVFVVIPAFNAEKFLAESLKSAQVQTFKSKQILVLNDGSTDNTMWLSHRLATNTVDRLQNKGIGFTRKEGVEFATGDYIAYLSADDAYHPYFLELMMREADGRSILFSDFWRCDENLKPIKVDMAPPFKTQEQFRKLAIEWALNQTMFVNLSTVIVPKQVFKQVQFDENLRFGEDLIFLLETVLANIPWKHVSLPLVYYRVHRESGTGKGQMHAYTHELWQRLAPLLYEFGVEKHAVRHAMQSAYHTAVRGQRKRRIPLPFKNLYRKLRSLTI